jgi:hypothetical protein
VTKIKASVSTVGASFLLTMSDYVDVMESEHKALLCPTTADCKIGMSAERTKKSSHRIKYSCLNHSNALVRGSERARRGHL